MLLIGRFLNKQRQLRRLEFLAKFQPFCYLDANAKLPLGTEKRISILWFEDRNWSSRRAICRPH